MTTLEEIQEAIVPNHWNEGGEGGPYTPGETFDMEEAAQILDDAGVLNARERVEWYNVTRLDETDMLQLANLVFAVFTCDICNEEEYKGYPHNWDNFQGVNQGEGGPVDINGKEKYICAVCYSTNPLFW